MIRWSVWAGLAHSHGMCAGALTCTMARHLADS